MKNCQLVKIELPAYQVMEIFDLLVGFGPDWAFLPGRKDTLLDEVRSYLCADSPKAMFLTIALEEDMLEYLKEWGYELVPRSVGQIANSQSNRV